MKKDEIELEGEEFLLKVNSFLNIYNRFHNEKISYDDFVCILKTKILPLTHHNIRHYL